ncbi:MAG: glutamate--tRNA ligase [Pseudomonadota bacterium]
MSDPSPSCTKTPSSRAVVTRFAPSPTGFLHIGGARTALFNWLLARHHGGHFRLRIEDTDRERSSEAAVDAILDGMRWLGLDWDGDVVYQHQQADRHRAVVENLLAAGKAYRCYCTPEDLAEMRAKAEAEKRPPMYDGRWRDRDPSDAPPGVKPAIRLRSDTDGETCVHDAVQGDVTFQNANLDDLIILRSDGNPTYNLAVVVDDHDMELTHVVRGVDHLSNAARQSQIYKALGWDVPAVAHVPLIHGPDGAKLSKRHGALGVEAYREMGYLPAALRNYLVRLGWSHGDEEIFSTDEMVKLFGLDAVGKSPARFDFAKLADMNGIHMRGMDDTDLTEAAKAVMPEIADGVQKEAAFAAVGWDKFDAVVSTLKERSKTLVELIDGAGFLTAKRPLEIQPKAQKQLGDEGKAHLSALKHKFEAMETWTLETVEATVRGYCEEAGVGLGKAAQPLRAALSGSNVSPPIFHLIWVLGRDEAVARIADQVGG